MLAVLERVSTSSNLAILPLLAASPREIRFTMPLPAYSDTILVQSIGFLAHGLETLALDSLNIHDDVIIALSQSKSASTIQTLSARACRLTDRGCRSFKLFPALSALNIAINWQITEVGLVEISLCNSLVSLAVSCRPGKRAAACRVLLGDKSLPKLESLDLGPLYESAKVFMEEELISALESRQADRSLLRSLVLADFETSIPTLLAISELCPNLLHRCSLNGKMVVTNLSALPHQLQTFRSVEFKSGFNNALVESLLATSPELQHLYFKYDRNLGYSDDPPPPAIWENFRSLTSVSFTFPHSLKVGFKWPSSLRKLHLTASNGSLTHEKEDFCRSLADCAPRLQSLTLVVPDGFPSSLVDALLNRLPDLNSLWLRPSTGYLEPSGPNYYVSHPKLRYYTIACVPPVRTRPGYLPAISSAAVYKIADIRKTHYPSLRKVKSGPFGASDAASLPILLADKRIVAASFPQLARGLDDSIASPFFKATWLTSLKIVDIHLSEAGASELVKSLRNLRKLSMAVEVSYVAAAGLTWLKHSTLSSLQISFVPIPSQELQAIVSSKPLFFSILLTGESLPHLSCLKIHLGAPLVSSTCTIEKFPRLDQLTLGKTVTGRSVSRPMDFLLRKMPMLDSVHILVAVMNLKVSEVPLLSFLEIGELEGTSCEIDAPSLDRLSVRTGDPRKIEKLLGRAVAPPKMLDLESLLD